MKFIYLWKEKKMSINREKHLYNRVKDDEERGVKYHSSYYRLSFCPKCPTEHAKDQRCMRCETNTYSLSNGELIKSEISYICKYNSTGKPIETALGTCYVHTEDTKTYEEYRKANKIETIKGGTFEEITNEILELRDSVYRYYRETVKKYQGAYLNKSDYEDLHDKRGFSDESIEALLYFSIPSSNKLVYYKPFGKKVKMLTAVMDELYKKFGCDLLKVPGFVKKTNRNSDYITIQTVKKDEKEDAFVSIEGYYCPISNVLGYIEGMQYRLQVPIFKKRENGEYKQQRYFWFSSEVSSGSPIAYYLPLTIKKLDTVLISEGKTKTAYASEKLGIQSLAEAGVGNYRLLVHELIKLEEILDRKLICYTAIDMDKYDPEKEEVFKAELALITLLKQTGHQVVILEWDEEKAKGIDDALLVNLDIKMMQI
jgi:hypothetical protein